MSDFYNAAHNFETIAAELVRVAPTVKAAAFAEKIAAQVRGRGVEWIEANVHNLHVEQPSDQQYFPVAANRIFFIEKWQFALMNG